MINQIAYPLLYPHHDVRERHLRTLDSASWYPSCFGSGSRVSVAVIGSWKCLALVRGRVHCRQDGKRRRRRVDRLLLRDKTGIPFARAIREVAVRDQISKFSADLPQQLRDILDGTAVGHLTPPETTAEGVQMFAVCAKKETKTDTPEMREIRDQMFQEKFGAQAKRYLDNLRRAALIEYKMSEDNK